MTENLDWTETDFFFLKSYWRMTEKQIVCSDLIDWRIQVFPLKKWFNHSSFKKQ